MSRGCLSPVRSVTVTIDGVTHHGTYYVQGSVMHVPEGEPMEARTFAPALTPTIIEVPTWLELIFTIPWPIGSSP